MGLGEERSVNLSVRQITGKRWAIAWKFTESQGGSKIILKKSR
jgi:hypothetical protein